MVGVQVRDHDRVDVDVVDELAQLAEDAVAAVEQDGGVARPATRYPEHAPPASCQAGDFPSTVSCMSRTHIPRTGARRSPSTRLREGVGGPCALGPEGEGELLLGRQAALGRPEGRCMACRGSARTAGSGGRSSPRTSRASPSLPSAGRLSCAWTGVEPAFELSIVPANPFHASRAGDSAKAGFSGVPVGRPASTGVRWSWSLEPRATSAGDSSSGCAREGRAVRALGRDPERLAPIGGVEAARGDLLDGTGLDAALDGCSSRLLPGPLDGADGRRRDDFAEPRPPAAERFAAAATAAGRRARRLPRRPRAADEGTPSPHIASRLEVEEILLDAAPGATALRASILIGARSASFRILVRLVERLRLLPLPAWRDNVTQPIAERDAIEFLARTAATPASAGRSLDIAGPDVLSYGEMIERIAEQMGVGRTADRPGVSAHAARQRRRGRRDRPAARARAAADGEPRARPAAPRRRRARRGCTASGTLPFERAVDRALRRVGVRTEELAAW